MGNTLFLKCVCDNWKVKWLDLEFFHGQSDEVDSLFSHPDKGLHGDDVEKAIESRAGHK